MNHFKRSGLMLFALLATLVCFVALANEGADAPQQYNATVDLRKVFDNFYKTKQAKAKMDELTKTIVKKDHDLKAQLRPELINYTNLLASASDPSLTADERDRRKQVVAEKLHEINAKKADIAKFEKDSNSSFIETRRKIRDELMKEIFAVINSRDKSHHCTFDQFMAFEEENNHPGKILFPIDTGNNRDGNTIDLTDSVLIELNAHAPAETP